MLAHVQTRQARDHPRAGIAELLPSSKFGAAREAIPAASVASRREMAPSLATESAGVSSPRGPSLSIASWSFQWSSALSNTVPVMHAQVRPVPGRTRLSSARRPRRQLVVSVVPVSLSLEGNLTVVRFISAVNLPPSRPALHRPCAVPLPMQPWRHALSSLRGTTALVRSLPGLR
jgi:hypothetical protein